MVTFTVQTNAHSELLPITEKINAALRTSGVREGICVVFCPHTTAGITVNENADPDVADDILYQLDQIVPWNDPNYRHGEGNSAAHLKASMLGSSVSLIIENGRLSLGTWQGVYFAEFDGPRKRKVYVQILAST